MAARDVDLRAELFARPMLGFAIALALGLASGFYPVALLGVLPLLWWPRWLSYGMAFFALLGVALAPRPPEMVRVPIPFNGVVEVIRAPQATQRGERAFVEAGGRVFLAYFPPAQPIALRDSIRVRGTLRPLNPRTRTYWRHQGVAGTLSVRGDVERLVAGPPVGQWGQRIRRSFVGTVGSQVPADLAPVIDALCFNHDADLPPSLREQLARSGTIHIISASGLHVALIAAMLTAVLRLLPMPRWMQLGVLLTLLVVYGAAAGFRPPMVRSILMAGIFAVAYLFRREAEGISTVAASAVVTLLMMPSAIFDLGFQLSFVTMLALVAFFSDDLDPPAEWIPRLLLGAKLILGSSAVASVAAAPLLFYHFGEASWVGPLANLLIVPILPFLTGAALLAWLVIPVAPSLGGLLFDGVVEPLTRVIIFVVQSLGGPWAAIQLPAPPVWLICAFYALLFSLWRPRRRHTF